MVRKKMTQNTRKISPRAFFGIVAVGLIFSAGSVLYGQADEGVINVSQAINQSNITQRENTGEGETAPNPTRDARAQSPNGGLVGSGKPAKVQPAPEPVVEEATTTDAVTQEDEVDAEDSGDEGENSDSEEEGDTEDDTSEAQSDTVAE